MKWLPLALIPALAGCDALFRLNQVNATFDGDGGLLVDAPVPVDVPDGVVLPLCLGQFQAGNLCLASAPSDLMLTAQSIDTSDDPRCQTLASGGAGYCVIAGRSISVTGLVRVTGIKPLVLLSQTDITLTSSGVIDLSSKTSVVAPRVGAGANDSICVVRSGASQLEPTVGSPGGGAGGGAGGSFQGRGGAGGASSGNNTAFSEAALGVTPTRVRGGCPGGTGGSGTSGAGAGAGGSSGGAVYLLAGSSIVVGGDIYAWGGGGTGGGSFAETDGAGGGGGGTGGFIGLEAPIVTLMTGSKLLAHGGGGGGGQSGMLSGADGNEQSIVAPGFRIAGGASSAGGVGGDASAGNEINANDGGASSMTDAPGGGGGGGGGAGFIVINSSMQATAGALIYPPTTAAL